MKNMKMRKFLRGLFAGVLACGCLFAATSVEAKSGYIYDSDGKPIIFSTSCLLTPFL